MMFVIEHFVYGSGQFDYFWRRKCCKRANSNAFPGAFQIMKTNHHSKD